MIIFTAIGITFCCFVVAIILLLFFEWFIWPIVIAISHCRCTHAANKVYNFCENSFSFYVRKWWFEYKRHVIVGQDYTRVTSRWYTWEGVGKWYVHKGEEEE